MIFLKYVFAFVANSSGLSKFFVLVFYLKNDMVILTKLQCRMMMICFGDLLVLLFSLLQSVVKVQLKFIDSLIFQSRKMLHIKFVNH